MPAIDAPPTDRPRLAVRARFAAWVLIVSALLIGTPAWVWICDPADQRLAGPSLWAGYAPLAIAILALAALLATTPADAIRLKPLRSVFIVTLGAAWLQAVAALASQDPARWAIAAAVVGLAAGAAGTLARLGRSAWIATLFAWHPLVTFLDATPTHLLAAVLLLAGTHAIATGRVAIAWGCLVLGSVLPVSPG
jgi:hypothetical protein